MEDDTDQTQSNESLETFVDKWLDDSEWKSSAGDSVIGQISVDDTSAGRTSSSSVGVGALSEEMQIACKEAQVTFYDETLRDLAYEAADRRKQYKRLMMESTGAPDSENLTTQLQASYSALRDVHDRYKTITANWDKSGLETYRDPYSNHLAEYTSTAQESSNLSESTQNTNG